jgi:hypothetical protein
MWLLFSILLMVVATPGMEFWGKVRVGLLWPFFVCLYFVLCFKPYKFKADETLQDLRSQHGLDTEDELIAVVAQEIKQEIEGNNYDL